MSDEKKIEEQALETAQKKDFEKTVGEQLKEARLKQKKELKNASKKLCIRAIYLEALEEDRDEDLPGHAYTIGFLQSYADYLRLDADVLISQYRKEHPAEPLISSQVEDEMTPLYQNKRHVYMQYSLIGIGVLLFATLIYLSVSFFNSSTKEPSELSSEKPAVIDTLDIKPLDLNKSVQQDDGISSQKSEEGLDSLKPSVPFTQIQLLAEEDVWVELIDESQNKILFSRILKKDEKYQMDSNKTVFLTTGNAGGLRILVGSNEIEKIGPRGARRSRIQMDSTALMDGTSYRGKIN